MSRSAAAQRRASRGSRREEHARIARERAAAAARRQRLRLAGAAVGGVVYLGMLMLLRVEELSDLAALVPGRVRTRT